MNLDESFSGGPVTAKALTGLDTLPGEAMRCASLLKPFYAWVAEGLVSAADLHAMITRSDNEATDRCVADVGGLAVVLERLRARTGVAWELADTWGRVHTTAHQVLQASEALIADRSRHATDVIREMRTVTGPQTFGVREAWAQADGVHTPLIGVKTGWDLNDDEPFLRTHALVVTPVGAAVVLTRAPVTTTLRKNWNTVLRDRGPHGVLSVHETTAGHRIRAALTGG